MGLDFAISRRELCALGASALTLSGLAGCVASDSKDDIDVDAAPTNSTIPATEEYVRPIGRTCQEGDVTWLPQSGSGIEFAVVGTRATIEIVGDDNTSGDKDLCPRFAVLVDGKVVLDDTMGEPARIVEAFSNDTTRSAIVGVVHLSEASRGAIGVRSIEVESSEPDPVHPTQAKGLSIEFIGDSITCAYGVEAAGTDEPFTTKTENFMKSYAYLAAQELDADYSAVCYSGYGILSGWSADGSQNTDMLIPPLYDVVAPGHEQPWDFSAHTYDAVVINLGTNDFTYTGTDEERMAEFSREYADFLCWVRELNPSSYLVCTLGTMGALELYPSVEQAIDDYTAKTGDTRIVCYSTKPLDAQKDGCGTNGHPDVKTQRRDADTLVGVLRQVFFE